MTNDTEQGMDFLINDPEAVPSSEVAPSPWKILVIDDDDQVHAVTRLVLRSFRFRGRGLQLISVNSAREAREVLVKEKEIALALVDVVMETKTAGLDLVRTIRDEYKNRSIRLILRTGQPGHAPEQDVVVDYEIDAYMAKTDISAQKLSTAITASLRAYEFITEIQGLNAGLEQQVQERTAQLQESYQHLQAANQNLGQAVDTLRQLGEVGRDITANLEASAVFSCLRKHVPVLLDAPYLAIFRFIVGGDGLELAYGWQDEQDLPPQKILLAADDPVARAARDWRTAVSGSEQGPAGSFLSAIYVPLIIDQRLLGVMAVASHQAAAYGEREMLIFSTLCGYAAIALDNANAYQRLQQVQSKLVAQEKKIISQEKMAALGGLVSGVAHELNTPLGNSLMMAGMLQDELEVLQDKLRGTSMQKSDLLRFMQQAQDASNTINKDLTNAVKLINSFRQVAVDRSSEERRVFDLQQCAQDAVAALQDQITLAGHEIEIDLPKNLSLNSYPQALAQVFSQLIKNALSHAFHDKAHGKMRLSAKQESSGRVMIVFSDDGSGLSEADLKRVFDPFFKVHADSQGTGLGLSICSNIVASILSGHISAASTLGQGTSFQLELPLTAPEA